MFKRIVMIVIDSVGIGHGPDSHKFGDEGANTIGNIEKESPIDCPFMKSIGLSEISDVAPYEAPVKGIFGRLCEISTEKDTTSGHWEFMGHPVKEPFPVFYDAFPDELMELFMKETGHGYLGNEVASGTEIIQRLGEEHMESRKLIVYTSADSVFQIAAHEDIIPLKELYRICEITRNKVCVGKYNVGRIIGRPFIGEGPGHFVRTSNRHDYSRMPEHTMYHEKVKAVGYDVIGVGKIGDIYAHIGFTASYPTISNEHGMMTMYELLKGGTFTNGLLMANLVDFDSQYGHRRDVPGYRRAIERFDYQLKALCQTLDEGDLLLVTADHGNDPTWTGTDHTREMVPLLGYYKGIDGPICIGDRKTFADLGQSILENFKCPPGDFGTSFLEEIKRG